MKGSVQAAEEFREIQAATFSIRRKVLESKDIRPCAGRKPKDGPSAGVAMVTSIVSRAHGIPVHKDVATDR